MFSLYVGKDYKGYSQKVLLLFEMRMTISVGSDLCWCSIMNIAELALIWELSQCLAPTEVTKYKVQLLSHCSAASTAYEMKLLSRQLLSYFFQSHSD